VLALVSLVYWKRRSFSRKVSRHPSQVIECGISATKYAISGNATGDIDDEMSSQLKKKPALSTHEEPGVNKGRNNVVPRITASGRKVYVDDWEEESQRHQPHEFEPVIATITRNGSSTLSTSAST